MHYCDKYTDNREIISNSLNWLPSNINIDVNLLTKGSDLLTFQENITIFKHAFIYKNIGLDSIRKKKNKEKRKENKYFWRCVLVL
jgi:hypothetical protein